MKYIIILSIMFFLIWAKDTSNGKSNLESEKLYDKVIEGQQVQKKTSVKTKTFKLADVVLGTNTKELDASFNSYSDGTIFIKELDHSFFPFIQIRVLATPKSHKIYEIDLLISDSAQKDFNSCFKNKEYFLDSVYKKYGGEYENNIKPFVYSVTGKEDWYDSWGSVSFPSKVSYRYYCKKNDFFGGENEWSVSLINDNDEELIKKESLEIEQLKEQNQKQLIDRMIQ